MSIVYFGSPRQARLEAKETLPAKLDLILEQAGDPRSRQGRDGGDQDAHRQQPRLLDRASGLRAQGRAGRERRRRQAVCDRCELGCARRGRTRLQLRNDRLPGVPHGRAGREIFLLASSPVQEHSGLESRRHDSGCLVPDQSLARQRTSVVQFRRGLQESGAGLHDRRDARRDARRHALRSVLVCRSVSRCRHAPAHRGRLPARRHRDRSSTIPKSCTCTSSSAINAGAVCRWRRPAA